MSGPEDHDLLIELRTLLKSHIETQVTFRDDIREEMGALKKDVAAEHRRLDHMTLAGILALIFFGFSTLSNNIGLLEKFVN